MFTQIESLHELVKSYIVASYYDSKRANELLETINELRLEIAVNSDLREIYYAQVNVPANATGFGQSLWFTKDDIKYSIVRGIAALEVDTTISAANQGNSQRIITREPISWQQLFTGVFSENIGQLRLLDLPNEILFDKNEAFGISLQNQTTAGYIFYHGTTFKENLENTRVDELRESISKYIPQPNLVPIIFQFPSATADTKAVNAAGGNDIFSAKYDKDIILTHVSTTAINAKFSIVDTSKNQTIADNVEAQGIAGFSDNPYESYYRLPHPHLLQKGSRLKLNAINGSDITTDTEDANTLLYLTFKGYSA